MDSTGNTPPYDDDQSVASATEEQLGNERESRQAAVQTALRVCADYALDTADVLDVAEYIRSGRHPYRDES
jgi:hypothetical protein